MFCSTSRLQLIHENFQSSNPPFTSVEMDHSDSGREGCTVTTLTVTAEPKNWQSAVRVAVQEVVSSNNLNEIHIWLMLFSIFSWVIYAML